MAGDHQGAARAQAPPGAHGAVYRPRRHLHRRHIRPHRHPEQDVRHAVLERVPEHRLPGARRGPARQRRQRDAQQHSRVARGHGAGRAGRRGRRGLGDGYRPVHRARRQGHREWWRPHPRILVRPRPTDLRPPPGPGRAADHAERRGHGPRDGAEVRLQGGPARQDSAQGTHPDVHHHGHRRASGRPTTWPERRSPPSRPRPRSASSATWVSSTTSTLSRNRVRTRRPCSTTSRGCCRAASRW